MFKSVSILRFIASFAAGTLITLVVFGLLLAMLWALVPQESGWKLISAFLASALALFAGGFVVAWLSRAGGWTLAAAFGLFFGGFSFIYLLGPGLVVLAFAAVSTLAAALGALAFNTARP